jgi:hypothetical protein
MGRDVVGVPPRLQTRLALRAAPFGREEQGHPLSRAELSTGHERSVPSPSDNPHPGTAGHQKARNLRLQPSRAHQPSGSGTPATAPSTGRLTVGGVTECRPRVVSHATSPPTPGTQIAIE